MLKGQQVREHCEKVNADSKTVRLAGMLDKCCAEGLLDWKALLGSNDCLYCPVKKECDTAYGASAFYSYLETRTQLKGVFKEKHKWARTHSLLNLVRQGSQGIIQEVGGKI